MKPSVGMRAIEPRAIAKRPAGAASSWQQQLASAALAFGVLMGAAPLESVRSAQLLDGNATTSIARDSRSKSEARDAKRAERAAAREAKKKERASRASKAEDRSLAKAKAPKSAGAVDLGDDDPLEGL